ncbi:FlhC family transcriptional regulator [Ralstonia insidiosa]|jgi:hypothetical protein|uniref:Flagellar transcriptional regulator FlhC n=11 Tax=Bacteria TaxID=2 RepID=A0A2P4RAG6_RALPI|nr:MULTISPECIES: FlhC family transcriptional regulator [Ralstonia]MBA4231803.1 hypothetical protein [Ralstonia sp.]MBA4235817.1 hypothetical protein [Ralstonia sp.]MBA4278996.1 hypothetical protein [Ralstonia sp.]MBA9847457.1 hypothetical protein [Ralstonia pickettii]MBA9852889.1 hypothetical protein [Ralstonia pickettii]
MTRSTALSAKDSLILPDRITDRIRSINYQLADFMGTCMLRHREVAPVFGVRPEELAMLAQNAAGQRQLMGTPFLVVTPMFKNVEDWRSLIKKTTPTLAIDKVKAEFGNLDPSLKMSLFHQNKDYVWMVVDLLHSTPVAAQLLGMPQDLADYLVTVSQHELELAIFGANFPMFRWRFENPMFWLEYSANLISEETICHHVMNAGDSRAPRPLQRERWGNFRVGRAQMERYTEALIGLRCRASSVASMFPGTAATARALYRQIHGESSPCGLMPSSSSWYVESVSSRIQSTTLIWLYWSALAARANEPEAFITALDTVGRLFGDAARLTPDRAFHLARSVSTGSDLSMSSCRTCSTHYLTCNTTPKIELAASFYCPSCTGALTAPRKGKPRKQLA